MVGAGGSPTGRENAAAGRDTANADATATTTGDKELADLPDYVVTDI